ncbi:hypothetical protein [Streptomyces sp. NPDC001980]|uniref:hypothetical protein n=1 Tax=Streptomyces sp. NPDC001980 TaxID=3157126 RepID=UPI003317119E
MAEATTGRTTAVDATARIQVEQHDGLVVLRSAARAPAGEVDDLVRVLRWSGDPTVTLLSDAATTAEPDFWPRLSALLDSLRASGHTAVRLAMPGAGEERPGQLAPARRISDNWGITVEAPAAGLHLVPGGSLYAPSGPGRRGGWLGFAPGMTPVPLGARCPRPVWQAALDQVPAHTAGGYVTEQIPAGLYLRPARAAGSVPGDLFHTVPVDPRRLTVVVGGLPGEEVPADDVVDVLSALPDPVRDSVRLAPGGPRDLLPLAQEVADRLGVAVVAATGLPLLTDGPVAGARGVRSVVTGADGAPGWLPFVNAAECRPAGATGAPASRLLGCVAPLPGSAVPSDDGSVRLTDRWQVTVTRAGLWLGEPGAVRSGSGLPVGPDGPVIEAGAPGRQTDDSLWPALDHLLTCLPPQVRATATLQVYGTSPADDPRLRDLTTRHGLRTGPAATAVPGGTEAVRHAQTPAVGAELAVRHALSDPALPRPAAEPGVPRASADPGESRASAAALVPRTSADPVAAPDLTGAWEHLIRGREEVTAPREPLAPDAPAGPDLDVAWEYLSRRSATVADSADGQTPRPGPSRPDATEQVRPVPARSSSSSFRAGHRSSPAEHTALRLLAGPAWERHAPAVARALTRLPALSDAEREAAEADLTALRLYLDDPGGLLDHRALAAACHGRDDRLLPFAACLVSALRRLPTHRGAVLRGAGSALPEAVDPETDPLRPGTVLRDRAPLGGVRAGAGGAGPGWPRGPRYAVWSVTGRLARPLFADPGRPEEVQEVVFAPGTPFMILDVRRTGPSPVVLLRELPSSGGAPASKPGQDAHAELGEADRAALAGLDEALRGRGAQSAGGGWPERCAGPVGEGP